MNTLLVVGIVLMIIGFFIVFWSFASHGQENVEVKTGGVIVVGPLPIVFGSDKEAVLIAVIGAVVLMALAFIWFWAH